MILDDRKTRILQAIVEEYVNNAEPIASRAVADKYNLSLSSATVRNEMANLEEMGYLEQPHTSSGRIPSDKGYRYYVDEIMDIDELYETEINKVKARLQESAIDNLLRNVSEMISNLTHYTSVMIDRNNNEVRLYGRNNVFDYPEFNTIDNLRKFMYLIEEEDFVRKIIGLNEDEKIKVRIGSENIYDEIKEYTLITCDYNNMGTIGIIGPRRMDYKKVISYLKYIIN